MMSRPAAAELISLSHSLESWADLRDRIVPFIAAYEFDHYRRYPAIKETAWQALLLETLSRRCSEPESLVIVEADAGPPFVLAAKLPSWDKEHFGFGMASVELAFCPRGIMQKEVVGRLLSTCLDTLRARNVRFVSARISGDMIPAIHVLEGAGFEYYETIVWPVTQVREAPRPSVLGVRLMREADLADALRIAATSQYQGGHFHSDERFNRRKVDELYAKWLRTSWAKKEFVAVVEHAGRVCGYFIFLIDEELSRSLGFRYGRLRSLALEASVRGLGLGRKLFTGTLALIKEMGGKYVDSGYATKNHASAKLHTENGFYSTYEEVTLHKWL
jgi:ribosomal protein S18 acetylase RimI-like enzyme